MHAVELLLQVDLETVGLGDEAVDGDDLGVQGDGLIQSRVWGTLRGRSCRTGGRGGAVARSS